MKTLWTAIKALITLVEDIRALTFRLEALEQELETINKLLLIHCDKIRESLS